VEGSHARPQSPTTPAGECRNDRGRILPPSSSFSSLFLSKIPPLGSRARLPFSFWLRPRPFWKGLPWPVSVRNEREAQEEGCKVFCPREHGSGVEATYVRLAGCWLLATGKRRELSAATASADRWLATAVRTIPRRGPFRCCCLGGKVMRRPAERVLQYWLALSSIPGTLDEERLLHVFPGGRRTARREKRPCICSGRRHPDMQSGLRPRWAGKAEIMRAFEAVVKSFPSSAMNCCLIGKISSLHCLAADRSLSESSLWLTRLGLTYVSIGGQEQTKFLSPCTSSMRPTLGHNFVSA